MSFYPLEQISNISEGYIKCFNINGQECLLVNSGGKTYLINNQCPHEGSSLKRARLANGCIQCPKHKIVFRLDSGQPMGGDAVSGIEPLRRYPLIEQDGKIGLLSTE